MKNNDKFTKDLENYNQKVDNFKGLNTAANSENMVHNALNQKNLPLFIDQYKERVTENLSVLGKRSYDHSHISNYFEPEEQHELKKLFIIEKCERQLDVRKTKKLS